MRIGFSQWIDALRRRRQSTAWANEVEQTEHIEGTDSIAPNLGMKLDFVLPLEHHRLKIQCTDMNDIQSKINFGVH